MPDPAEDSTPSEKFVVGLVGFAFACLAFFLSVFVLVPLTGYLADAFRWPGLLSVCLIMGELLGLPVIAATFGVSLATRPIASNRRPQP